MQEWLKTAEVKIIHRWHFTPIYSGKKRTPSAIFSASVDQVFLPHCMEHIYSCSGFLHFHPTPSPSASYEHIWNHLCRLHTFMEISVEDKVISLTFFSGLRFNSKRYPGALLVTWCDYSAAQQQIFKKCAHYLSLTCS